MLLSALRLQLQPAGEDILLAFAVGDGAAVRPSMIYSLFDILYGLQHQIIEDLPTRPTTAIPPQQKSLPSPLAACLHQGRGSVAQSYSCPERGEYFCEEWPRAPAESRSQQSGKLQICGNKGAAVLPVARGEEEAKLERHE